MRCKYCGYALSNNSAICPHCKRLMSDEQLKMRKETNGINNPYMERLNKLNEEKIKNNLENNDKNINIKPYLIILAIIIIIGLLAVIL